MLKKLVRMLFGKSGQSTTDTGKTDARKKTGKDAADSSRTRNAGPGKSSETRARKPRSSHDTAGAGTGTSKRSNNTADNKTANRHSSGGLPPALRKLDLRDVDVVAREDHNISRRDISPNALKVLYRLNDAGFQAFLVGGGVRDLLLGGHPKDFDISTDATPEQVREVFRNSRIIGRRFKIAHVRFGQEIIEVTTFRAHHEIETEVEEGESRKHIRDLDSAHSSTGMILRDNVYGSINEDALRRDFTVNALYYTTNGFWLLDFVDGLPDIKNKLIRMIGDPEQRYREDPVRILRAIRLAAKLDFKIHKDTETPIAKLATLLESISSARLFDETVKLFTGGSAEATFELLRRYKVADYLFKPTLRCLGDNNSNDSRLVLLALQNTDKRLADGKSVTPAFLYAALLWPPMQALLKEEFGDRPAPLAAMQDAATDVIVEQLRFTAIPKRFTAVMREIWELQWRMQPQSRKQVESVIAHPRFRAAYDFLLLREESGEQLNNAGDWWTRFQLADRGEQEVMIEGLQAVKAPRKRRRKPNKSSAASKQADQPQAQKTEPAGD
ncbi:MAG: polynucleotide adenylyltransferase PcnB [Pseudohongiella sp.]|nr:polynucleotide adenylyltransferase PcnB [Pseudohongiella sp.]